MFSRLPFRHNRRLRRDSRQRQPAANGLAERHNVGRDAEMLIAKPFAGAPYSRLDFIRDQQNPAFLRERRIFCAAIGDIGK